jgi:predicted ATPase
MLKAMQTLNTRLEQDKGIRLAIRVGIHTGLTVVGDIGEGQKHELLALGEAPNIAARIQGVAEPDTVAISAVTFQLIEGYFTCQDLGSHMLKGVETPVQIYRVLSESGAQSRLDIVTTRGLTPLVGREQEVGLLLERWGQVKDGQGQVVLLSGEGGIGKSRLVQVLKEHVAEEAHTRFECRSSPYFQNTALYPMTDLIERTVQLQREDSPDEKVSKLERTLSQFTLDLEETVPLFATLLSLPLSEERYPPLPWTPQRQRQKTLETMVAILLELAERQPVLFIVENTHWLDPSTLELLDLLIDQAPTSQILTLFTYRPEFQPTWGNRSYLTQVTLNRLSRSQVEQIVERITDGQSLPAEVLQQIVEKTDGVPLFVEELTKAILESGHLKEVDGHYELTGALPSLAIPSTLQDSLMARLDRLVTAKAVAQYAAVIGRQFTYALLQAVSQLDEPTLQRELGRLVDAELVYQRGLPPQATYLFKHALIQDAAYQSLLKSTRQQYHQRIAQVLEEYFPETAEAQPELLAHHYTEAGLIEQAVGYWHQAGQGAVERSANVEAIAHLNKGLEVLKILPETPERTQQELAVLASLGPALIVTKGQASPEVEQVYARARELCMSVGETPQLSSVLLGLWVFYLVRAELQTARELSEQLLTLAQRQHDTAMHLQAHRALGAPLLCLGDLTLARGHFEQGIALYDSEAHRSLVSRYDADPGVVCLSWTAQVLWLLGYPDQASDRRCEALRLAQELSHPYSLAFALGFAAQLHQCRQEWQASQGQAEAVIALSTAHGFSSWVAVGTIVQGWALVEQGQRVEGITQIRQGLTAFQATGAKLYLPYYAALLAEAYGKAGQIEEGLAMLTEALVLVDKTEERWYTAEIHRLKGVLLLAQSPDNQTRAEACLHQALSIARRQEAKSLELRTAMSLARLWQQQDKRQDAYDLLAPVYGWFTEGFDAADLKEAKALLEELVEGRS